MTVQELKLCEDILKSYPISCHSYDNKLFLWAWLEEKWKEVFSVVDLQNYLSLYAKIVPLDKE